MSLVGRLSRRFVEPLLSTRGLDLRSVRKRLDRFHVRHAELSAILSMDDSPGRPSGRLLDLVSPLVSRARRLELTQLRERNAPGLVHVWPGEHYRLLAALVYELKPLLSLEIGTHTGLSALAMLSALAAGARILTVDILKWEEVPGTFLQRSDFSSGRLSQIVCDLGAQDVCESHASLVRQADLIFLDASKDGVFEKRILENFASIGLKPGVLLVFDDIRVWNMIEIWRQIARPKLDLTSLGHWSGTGLVDWNPQSLHQPLGS